MKTNTKDLMKFAVAEGGQTPVQTNADAILRDFQKILYIKRKRNNDLLGGFNDKGDYKITDKLILKKLLEVPKKFGEKQDDVVYASAVYDTLVLNFKIVFEMSPEFCNAYLYFIEVENLAEEDIKHVTLLDTILDVYSPTFKQKVYEEWRVYLDEEIYEKDDFLFEILKKQQDENQFTSEFDAILAQLFVLRMLKALENCDEVGKEILDEYNEFLQKAILKDPSLAQDDQRLIFILNKIILKHSGYEALLKTTEGVAVLTGYIKPMQRVLGVGGQSILDAVGKNAKKLEGDKKVEKKAEKPKVKASVKAKGKGAKKAAKIDAYDIGGAFSAPKKPDAPVKKPLLVTTELPKKAEASKGSSNASQTPNVKQNPPVSKPQKTPTVDKPKVPNGKLENITFNSLSNWEGSFKTNKNKFITPKTNYSPGPKDLNKNL